jgi:hypothetical protein
MTGTLSIHVTILLSPELAVDSTTLQQRRVRRDIHHLAFVQHHDLIAID